MSAVADLEQLMAPDGRRFYGVALAAVGDDGDWIVAAGHVEPRRMAAAAEAYARDAGLGSLRDIASYGDGEFRPLATALGLISYEMAQVQDPYCTHGGHDDGETCPAPAGEWGLDWRTGMPGRTVPVTVLDWAP